MMTKRTAFLGQKPKKLSFMIPEWLYHWLKKKAETEGVEMAKVARKILVEAMRRETGSG